MSTTTHTMPRTRLVWHLFIAWCSLVAAVLVASSWLASVQLAGIAEEDQRLRLTELARLVGTVTTPGDGPLDPEAFAAVAGTTRTESGVALELLAIDGRPLDADQPAGMGAATPRMAPGDERLLAAATRPARAAVSSRWPCHTAPRPSRPPSSAP
ncbi:hypothetical protein EBR04_06795, partial [bacterium]|nr:hypothetical protein [bacterium]